MKKLVLVTGALASTMFAAGRAEANCASVTFTGPTAVSNWNPLNNGTGLATFTATATRVTTGKGTVTSARIIFLDAETGVTRIGQAGPEYEIVDTRNNVVSAPSGTAVPTSSLVEHFTWGDNKASNVSGPVTFTVRVLPSASTDWTAGTNFSEPLKYSIQCFDVPPSKTALGSNTNVTGGPTLQLTVPSLVQLTTGSAATIDFGSFSTATQTIHIGLKSTSTLNVTVETANNGRMVLAGSASPQPSNSVIAYGMTLNSVPIANGTRLNDHRRAGVSGTSWPLVLTLNEGVPSGKVAGSYSDTITLTLSPGS